MNFLDKRITITGGKGFLGKHLVSVLSKRGYKHITVADLPEYNLVRMADVKRMYRETTPDTVIHLAAKVGGIGFNKDNPASLFYENAMMGVQLLHEGYASGIDKFLALGTICAYPKCTQVPFREETLWEGYPEETNAPYGLAKKMMLVQSQAYREQYGFNSIFLLPVNLYGPGDNFNFTSSHVIPALIRKFHLADLLAQGDYQGILCDLAIFGNALKGGKGGVRKPAREKANAIHKHLESFGIRLSSRNKLRTVAVEIWGTGKATREFFYVEDAAEAIALAFEKYNKSDPVNIGAGFEISIKELAHRIGKLMGFEGKIVFNAAQPDGQPRRRVDTTRAAKEFGFTAKTGLEEGLQKTIEWYRTAHSEH